MKEHQKISKEQLAIFISLLTGIVYFMGYVKYYIVLDALNFNISVMDIYSLTNIFVSGIVILVSICFIPCICILSNMYLYPVVYKHQVINKKEHIKINIITDYLVYKINPIGTYSAILGIFIIIIKKALKGFILKTDIHIEIGSYIFMFDILFIILFLVLPNIKVKRKQLVHAGILMIWIILIFRNYALNIYDVIDGKKNLSSINQDIGFNGIITTDIAISNKSIEVDNDRYDTDGLILSANNDTYYFAVNDSQKYSLYLIRDNHIVYILNKSE